MYFITKLPNHQTIKLIALCIVICVLCITSCTKKPIEIPADILPKDKMISLIADVHVAQAGAVVRNPTDTLRYTFNEYLPFILQNHNITKAEYDSSLAFYTSHPELMKELYEEVINELSKKQGEVQTENVFVR